MVFSFKEVSPREFMRFGQKPFAFSSDVGAALSEGYPLIAYRRGVPCARICLFNGGAGLFSADNVESGRAMLEYVAEFASYLGMKNISAPVSPLGGGLLVEGFEQNLSLFFPHNPPWYEQCFKGLSVIEESVGVSVDFLPKTVERVKRVAEWLKVRHSVIATPFDFSLSDCVDFAKLSGIETPSGVLFERAKELRGAMPFAYIVRANKRPLAAVATLRDISTKNNKVSKFTWFKLLNTTHLYLYLQYSAPNAPGSIIAAYDALARDALKCGYIRGEAEVSGEKSLAVLRSAGGKVTRKMRRYLLDF